MEKKPTIRTKLSEAPDDDMRKIIKLLRQMRITQKEIHNLFKNEKNTSTTD